MHSAMFYPVSDCGHEDKGEWRVSAVSPTICRMIDEAQEEATLSRRLMEDKSALIWVSLHKHQLTDSIISVFSTSKTSCAIKTVANVYFIHISCIYLCKRKTCPWLVSRLQQSVWSFRQQFTRKTEEDWQLSWYQQVWNLNQTTHLPHAPSRDPSTHSGWHLFLMLCAHVDITHHTTWPEPSQRSCILCGRGVRRRLGWR